MKKIFLPCLLFFACLTTQAQPQVATLYPSKDNTLFESVTGSQSNGAGPSIFAGRNNQGALRRAVIKFDVNDSIIFPIGSNVIIDSVRLQLECTNAQPGGHAFSLHRLTQDWGEGTSNATGSGGQGEASTTGDATWVHTFFNTSNWNTAGGDYDASSSATSNVNGLGAYSWSSAQMTTDVANWLSNPASNFGYILIGGEGVNQSAKRFGSRESTSTSEKPLLTIYYSIVTGLKDPQSSLSVSVYPNPAEEQITIDLGGYTGMVTIQLTDLTGKTWLTDTKMITGKYHVPTFDLSPGTWFVQVWTGDNRQTVRFVK